MRREIVSNVFDGQHLTFVILSLTAGNCTWDETRLLRGMLGPERMVEITISFRTFNINTMDI